MLFKKKERTEEDEKKQDEKFAAEYVKLCEKHGRELVAVNFAVKRIQTDAS